MDPLRIVVRVAFAFVVAFVLMRISGHRTIKDTSITSFIVSLVIGDLFDDLFWAEIGAAQFTVAIGTLVVLHIAANTNLARSGVRNWRRPAAVR